MIFQKFICLFILTLEKIRDQEPPKREVYRVICEFFFLLSRMWIRISRSLFAAGRNSVSFLLFDITVFLFYLMFFNQWIINLISPASFFSFDDDLFSWSPGFGRRYLGRVSVSTDTAHEYGFLSLRFCLFMV
jgi:hypothetical protein